jgi:hypothetical protein
VLLVAPRFHLREWRREEIREDGRDCVCDTLSPPILKVREPTVLFDRAPSKIEMTFEDPKRPEAAVPPKLRMAVQKSYSLEFPHVFRCL